MEHHDDLPYPPFRYMRWAKRHHGGARFNLAKSGMPEPPAALLPLQPLAAELLQQAEDVPPLARRRIAQRYQLAEARTMLTLGSSHGLHLACAALLAPDSGCLVESPTYEVLAGLPRLFHAKLGRFERTFESGYRLPTDLPARVLAERPRLVIVSNPHNPSGALLSNDELKPLADAVAQVGAVLLVDEVYLEFVRDAPGRSAVHLGEHVAVVSSFTKTFGLGTVRFGWLLGSVGLIERAVGYNDYISVLYPNPCAWVGMAALDSLAALQRHAWERRDSNAAMLTEWLATRPDIEAHPTEAGIVVFPRFRGVADASALCERLRRDHDVALVPGRFFGAPAHVRLGFGTPPDELRAALEALAMGLDAAGPSKPAQ